MYSASSELANVPVTTALHRQIVDLICVIVHAISVSSSCFLARSFSKAAPRNSMPGVFDMIWDSAEFLTHIFFHARPRADSVFMHLFLHLFHATLVRAFLFASLSGHLNTVSQQAHGTCQKTKQKIQQINLRIFHDPLVIFLLFAPACTTHCMV
jgi:hypothetical protein